MSALSNDMLETAAAYALGALDADEAAAFESVLATSPELQREVESLREVSGMLGAATAPVAPSAGLKQSLMAQVAATPQLPREQAPAAPTEPTAAPSDAAAPSHAAAHRAPTLAAVSATPAAAPAPIPMSGLASEKANARWFSRPASLVAAAAAAVALFFGGVFAADLVNPAANDQQVLAQVVAAPDATVASSEVAGGATASLVSSESLGVSVMVFDGLDELSSDEAYALWYITGDEIAPAGLFTVDGSGEVVQVLDGEFVAGTVVGVTVEPADGSPQPTSEPIVAIATTEA
ncbi:anti-sigma-K factor rskA [Microcella putealis]|uniref:Regulator of SigK n=1 Tax=Microcella putealis TaxID=337005 RepID=A0A4Q7LK83_9MICO|nr:anti-sigma factor [Microcella putealis]RZS55055.1 anti-sigma-K factor rskA [Microcella putealis]TQM19591.1 anti-sigma-K factor rskA [Microcella putealis]